MSIRCRTTISAHTRYLKARVAHARVDRADWARSVSAIRSVSMLLGCIESRCGLVYNVALLPLNTHEGAFAHALAYVCGFACVRVGVHARGCALLPRRAALRGTLGLLRWYLRDINGTRRVLGEYSVAYSMAYSCSWCALGYVGGTPRKCVRACDTLHLLGLDTQSQEGCTTLHLSSRRTGSTGGVLDEYSPRLVVVRSIAARASAQGRLQPRQHCSWRLPPASAARSRARLSSSSSWSSETAEPLAPSTPRPACARPSTSSNYSPEHAGVLGAVLAIGAPAGRRRHACKRRPRAHGHTQLAFQRPLGPVPMALTIEVKLR
jgi:hypothetical protein